MGGGISFLLPCYFFTDLVRIFYFFSKPCEKTLLELVTASLPAFHIVSAGRALSQGPSAAKAPCDRCAKRQTRLSKKTIFYCE